MVQIQCECGYVARGESEDTVLGLIQDHLGRDHPGLAGSVGADDIRSWIEVLD